LSLDTDGRSNSLVPVSAADVTQISGFLERLTAAVLLEDRWPEIADAGISAPPD
jgi:hypothetical protein